MSGWFSVLVMALFRTWPWPGNVLSGTKNHFLGARVVKSEYLVSRSCLLRRRGIASQPQASVVQRPPGSARRGCSAGERARGHLGHLWGQGGANGQGGFGGISELFCGCGVIHSPFVQLRDTFPKDFVPLGGFWRTICVWVWSLRRPSFIWVMLVFSQ